MLFSLKKYIVITTDLLVLVPDNVIMNSIVLLYFNYIIIIKMTDYYGLTTTHTY